MGMDNCWSFNFAGTGLTKLNPTVMETPECVPALCDGKMRVWNAWRG